MQSFVPQQVLGRLARAPLVEPEATGIHAAVLLLDLSGFSSTADRLAREGGADGVEELTALVNDVFEQLIETVHSHGGDVIRFAGDALLVLFPVDRDRAAVARAAVQCALACARHSDDTRGAAPLNAVSRRSILGSRGAIPQGSARSSVIADSLGSGSMASTPRSSFLATNGEAEARVRGSSNFAVHAAVALGEVFAVYVGGVGGRWEFCLASTAQMDTLSTALRAALPGQVVVDPTVAALLEDQIDKVAVQGHSHLARVVRFRAGAAQSLSPPTDATDATDGADGTTPPGLDGFVPPVVLERLGAGHTDLYLSELRVSTVVFVGFPSLVFHSADDLEGVQAAVAAVQGVLVQTGGLLRQAMMDDKGFVIVAGFGLPPHVHADHATRALRAALHIRQALQSVRVSVGVATGRTFAGLVGSSRRREYALVSATTNLAARLMHRFVDDVTCDGATRRAAEGLFSFRQLPSVNLKGFDGPVAVFSPVAEASKPPSPVLPSAGPGRCVGRVAEKNTLLGCVRALVAQQPTRDSAQAADGEDPSSATRTARLTSDKGIIVEGEAGIGKSVLVQTAHAAARNLLLPVVVARGSELQRTTPYSVARQVLMQLLDWDSHADAIDRKAHVLRLLSTPAERPMSVRSALSENFSLVRLGPVVEAARMRANAPTLCDLVPLGFEMTKHVRAIDGQARADVIAGLVSHIAAVVTAGRAHRTLVVVEDAHWMDDKSWRIIADITRSVPGAFVLLSTRPVADENEHYAAVRNSSGVTYLPLTAMDREHCAELASSRLGIARERLPDDVLEAVWQRARGHPFFTVELIGFLEESGKVATADDGTVRLVAGSSSGLELPGSIEAMVVQRIDRLSSDAQLLVKVASVVGSTFDAPLLCSVFPSSVPLSEDKFGRLAGELVAADLVVDLAAMESRSAGTHGPHTTGFAFKHAILETVAYSLLLGAQRRSVHLAVARALLAEAEDVHSVAPLLSHHFLRGGARGEAVRFLAMAGEQAASINSARETLLWFRNLFEILDEDATLLGDYSNVVVARWMRCLAEAHQSLGQAIAAGEFMRRALALLGRPVPQHPAMLLGGVFQQVVVQWWHFRKRTYARVDDGTANSQMSEERLEACNIYGWVAHLGYEKVDVPLMLYGSIKLLNNAELAVMPNAFAVRGYLMMAISAQAAGRIDLGQRYYEMALEIMARADFQDGVVRHDQAADVPVYGRARALQCLSGACRSGNRCSPQHGRVSTPRRGALHCGFGGVPAGVPHRRNRVHAAPAGE